MSKQSKSASPENRRKTGGKLKNGLDPEIGRQTQFKPGESGNPGGRPPKPLSDAYAALLHQVFENDPKKRTYAQLIAEGQAKAAIKGATSAAKEIADRVEGQAKQSIELTGNEGQGVIVNFNIRFLDENPAAPIRSQERE